MGRGGGKKGAWKKRGRGLGDPPARTAKAQPAISRGRSCGRIELNWAFSPSPQGNDLNDDDDLAHVDDDLDGVNDDADLAHVDDDLDGVNDGDVLAHADDLDYDMNDNDDHAVNDNLEVTWKMTTWWTTTWTTRTWMT
jgi:hypothetical protein